MLQRLRVRMTASIPRRVLTLENTGRQIEKGSCIELPLWMAVPLINQYKQLQVILLPRPRFITPSQGILCKSEGRLASRTILSQFSRHIPQLLPSGTERCRKCTINGVIPEIQVKKSRHSCLPPSRHDLVYSVLPWNAVVTMQILVDGHHHMLCSAG